MMNKQTKLITLKEIQKEYLNIDRRRLQTLLNRFCAYKKIGRIYYYSRAEVERMLLDEENSVEYNLK